MTVPVVRQTAEWPQRNAAPADYATKADAVGASLPATISDINAAVSYINEQVTTAIELSEANLEAAASGFGNRMYDTAAEMNADLSPVHGLSAIVMDDPDATKNGWYYKSGASGAGSWVRLPDQPVSESRFEKSIFDFEAPQTSIVPIVLTNSGQVPLWLEDGKLNAAAIAAALVEKIRAGLALDAALLELSAEISALESRVIIKSEPAQASLVPVVSTESGQVVLWLKDGMLGTKGLTPDLVKTINSALSINYAPRNAPASTSLPLCTDGRSLFKWRAKLGQILAGDTSAKLRLGFTGDSWTEFVAIPQQFRTLLESQISNAGEGWQSVNKQYHLNGVLFDWSGFSYVSGNNVDVTGIPVGIDGKAIYTNSATAYGSLSNITATDITIYYWNYGGTFRYRVDGGSWVSVVGSGGDSLGAVNIGPLSDTVHTLDIDTTGNTGTVKILGFYATRTVGGVEVLKMGNGGQTGEMMRTWIPNIPGIAQDLDIDLLIVILGTNDYRTTGATVAEYVAALSELVVAYRQATPDLGFVFVAPADSDGFAVTPLTEYRDAMYQFCVNNGHEFLNMHDMFGTFEQSNALSQWADGLHLNSSGAENFVNEFNHQFLHIAGA